MTNIKENLRPCFICDTKLSQFDADNLLVKSRTEICFKFKIFVSRYLNLKSSTSTNQNLYKSTLNFKSVGVNNYSKLICCSTCVYAVESFCETYEGLKQLQLEILRILRGLSKLMTVATSRSPSSSNNKFREKFVTAVGTKQRRNYPHLRLKMLKRYPYNQTSLNLNSNSKFQTVNNGHRQHPASVSTLNSMKQRDAPRIEEETLNAPNQLKLSDSGSVGVIEDVNQENANIHKKAKVQNSQETASTTSRNNAPEDINDEENYEDDDNRVSFGNTDINGVSESGRKSDKSMNLFKPGLRSQECLLCGKIMSEKRGLIKHMRTHTREKPFYCRICGCEFANSTYAKYHWKTYTCKNPLPYPKSQLHNMTSRCLFCDKSKPNRHQLGRHMRMHTKEKPFSCCICKQEFATTCSLNKHKKNAVHANLQCDMCSRTYKDSASLRKHKNDFHQAEGEIRELRFKCDPCGFAFKKKPHLNRHLATSFHLDQI